ncbi:MAG: hypothetical protein ACD_22C00049G0010 [uncultured bacterium]|uniref:Heme-copper oxidase subunit III family profile domain-containing protein n=1 Tax=candidate division WWE3 bacterium TaxID=2053526 RepID=A0A656PNB0_UNCKA|nr:hypothetical protein P147_WWE3C00001G0341 [candidate division WWE3 bacterium RAAC2_WWE3_1]EKE00313.1 MAG: hypothetical protein ACD_22C00049G0010 [uncultured bacterium]KKS29689.1 MAG: hypothetical protein UU91_C0004G0081 [candidate division WWE3 bacterium GW2011_GWB1_42_117]KKS55499.1 MAG: hypothetical protein UV21_C0001G0081 [candidate division WWE3 bacterium GW2011_GWD2_42_34]KKT05984.1 MAG: hypothetical protein UV83_C0001G0302 [candidate division WWE3 bacterium GW2011_GWE2_43_18]KKT06902.
MLNKFSAPFLAFLQASALVTYLILISFFFNFVTPLFNNKTGEFYAPIIMLLLFVFSALISGMMILGRAGVLFWEKKYKESFTLLGWTTVWGFFYFVMMLYLLQFK